MFVLVWKNEHLNSPFSLYRGNTVKEELVSKLLEHWVWLVRLPPPPRDSGCVRREAIEETRTREEENRTCEVSSARLHKACRRLR